MQFIIRPRSGIDKDALANYIVDESWGWAMAMNDPNSLRSGGAPRGVQLALMWTSLMFLYVYNDYFSLYLPGAIASISAGKLGPLGPANDTALLGVSAMLAVPALMICLSILLPRVIAKWANIVFALAYTAIDVATFFGSPLFFQTVVVLETVLTLGIVVLAFSWPKVARTKV